MMKADRRDNWLLAHLWKKSNVLKKSNMSALSYPSMIEAKGPLAVPLSVLKWQEEVLISIFLVIKRWCRLTTTQSVAWTMSVLRDSPRTPLKQKSKMTSKTLSIAMLESRSTISNCHRCCDDLQVQTDFNALLQRSNHPQINLHLDVLTPAIELKELSEFLSSALIE